jgi:hypothetical protein
MPRGFGGRGFWGIGYRGRGCPYLFGRRFPGLASWGAAPYAPYYPVAMPGYPGAGYPPYYGGGLGYPYYGW